MSEETDPTTQPEQKDPNASRSTTPTSDRFREWISSGWADRPTEATEMREAAVYAAKRRERVSALFPGERLIIAAGPVRQRANDTDFPYRAHSAFSYLTGWGADTVPDSVLVFDPAADGAHAVTLFFRPTAGRDTEEFYANAAIGEFWTGPRPSLDDVAIDLGIATRDLAELEAALAESGEVPTRDLDDTELAQALSEMRLVKDEWEIGQLRQAIDATKRGFDDVIDAFPEVLEHERGERLVEGSFDRRARAEGNTVGYGTIAAAGPHACVLHWTRNDGAVNPGDLILIDAGVELDSLYTADITRTLPVSGRFSPSQRKVYEAVLEAADAAFAIVRPGIRFRDIHAEAMRVIAEKTADWGLLPVSAEESLQPDAQFHRRYMVHGTSHHLGLDVHDCAQARREMYMDGVLEPGMVFTIEPGLYFQPDDLTVPAELRGIGVRIEDDILVTEDGAERLSAGIPRTVDEVEAWIVG